MSAKAEYDDIHHWFGLSYCSYFTIPRLALQAMPLEWQQRFIGLMDEAFEKYGLETPAYHVLRDDESYTALERDDPEDEGSRIREFTIIQDDPWANYRRGDVRGLCPAFRPAPAPQQEDR